MAGSLLFTKWWKNSGAHGNTPQRAPLWHPAPYTGRRLPQPAAQRHSWAASTQMADPGNASCGRWRLTSYIISRLRINHRILCWGLLWSELRHSNRVTPCTTAGVYILCVYICPRVPDKGWRVDCWPRQACYVYPSSPGADRRRFSAEVFHNRVALFHIRSAVPYTGSNCSSNVLQIDC